MRSDPCPRPLHSADPSSNMASLSSASVDKKLETEGSVNAFKPVIESKEVDTAGQLTAGREITFTPEEAARIRCVLSIPEGRLSTQ